MKKIPSHLFTSDLFIQPGNNKSVTSDDYSESMINLYRGAGIFASEKPVRDTTKRLVELSPNMVYPMHGSCIDKSIFSKYVESIMKNDFAYSGILLGQNMEYEVTYEESIICPLGNNIHHMYRRIKKYNPCRLILN